MKIAVTGAAGTIGTRLCEDLSRDNDVVRIDITGVPSPVNVLKLDALEQAVKGCETLIHLAGVVKVKASWEETRENLEGTYNAFEAARRAGCKRVIFASSNHAVGMYEVDLAPGIYEIASGTLLTNSVPFRPDGLYGVWKCFGENLGRYYSDEYGMQVACLRIGGIRTEDTPTPGDVKNEATWLNISDEENAAGCVQFGCRIGIWRVSCARSWQTTSHSESSTASATMPRAFGISKRDVLCTDFGRLTA